MWGIEFLIVIQEEVVAVLFQIVREVDGDAEFRLIDEWQTRLNVSSNLGVRAVGRETSKIKPRHVLWHANEVEGIVKPSALVQATHDTVQGVSRGRRNIPEARSFCFGITGVVVKPRHKTIHIEDGRRGGRRFDVRWRVGPFDIEAHGYVIHTTCARSRRDARIKQKHTCGNVVGILGVALRG